MHVEFKVCKRGKVAIFCINDVDAKRSYEYRVYAADMHAYASLLQLAESLHNVEDDDQEFFDDNSVVVPKNPSILNE